MAYPEPEPNPVLLNKPGILCEVTAWTGKTARGTRKIFLLRSLPNRVNPRVYSQKERAKFLKDSVLWDIIQCRPRTVEVSGWELVSQYRMSMGSGPDGPHDVWPCLARVIRNTFGSPSRVWLSADVYQDDKIELGPPGHR